MDLLEILFCFISWSDWLALLVSGGLGYLAGYYMPHGWPSILTTMLVSYHLFLIWLLFNAKHDLQTIKSFGYVAGIHLAGLVVIVCLGSGRLFLPHFDWVCAGIALLAYFERGWLFEPRYAVPDDAEEQQPIASSEEEYHEWLEYLARQGNAAPAYSASRKQQFEDWLRARRRGQSA